MRSIVKPPVLMAAAMLLCASAAATGATLDVVTAKPALAAKAGGGAKKTTAKNHTISGVVKSIDDQTLVISRSGKKSDLTFALDSSTGRGGTIAVGTPVSVRYRMQGKSRSALYITARTAKQQASNRKK